jgi:hypothetical protein
VLESFKAIARTLSPRQVAHVKEALLKGDIAITRPGCKGKTIIVKPQISKKHIKTLPEAPNTLTSIKPKEETSSPPA